MCELPVKTKVFSVFKKMPLPQYGRGIYVLITILPLP